MSQLTQDQIKVVLHSHLSNCEECRKIFKEGNTKIVECYLKQETSTEKELSALGEVTCKARFTGHMDSCQICRQVSKDMNKAVTIRFDAGKCLESGDQLLENMKRDKEKAKEINKK